MEQRDDTLKRASPPKGVITRLFGVILIILAVLDSMLSWRGGFALSDMVLAFFASGAFLYAIGSVRRGGS